MKRIGDEVHIDVEEARGADTPHILRYVLLISLVLAIFALTVIWMTGSYLQHPTQGWPVTAEEKALGG
jgi:hypothetical protein